MHRSILWLILAIPAMAQAPQAAPPTASVSGVVRDAGTGAPLPEVEVSANRPGAKPVDTTTDAQGHYTLRDLPAGKFRIVAVGPSANHFDGPRITKVVTLSPGLELTGIDILIRGNAQLSGRVVDQNKEPVPGASVRLIAREYSLGVVRYVFAAASETNDQGEYVISRVEPGRGYLLQVQKRYQNLQPISESPVNPKLRRQAVVPTYYPGTSSLEGAQALVLNPGERREGIDIRVLRTQAYCIDGVIQSGTGPEALHFEIAEKQPTSGASGNGAMFISSPGGTTAADGKVRICDLHPGDYMITAYSRIDGPLPGFFGTAAVTIVDEDVTRFFVSAHPRVSVTGEVRWEGAPPDPPVYTNLIVIPNPMTRAPFGGEINATRVPIPGEFSLDLLMDEYSLQINGVAAGTYIKEASYAGQSVLREPFRPGTTVGGGSLRIVLARDGGTISAKVADKDNNPVSDATVLVMPASFNSEGVLAAALLSGQTDQNGTWSTATLAPGKYYVIASQLPVDKSPESIGRLSRSRTKAQEVELAPNATVQVTLAPLKIDE